MLETTRLFHNFFGNLLVLVWISISLAELREQQQGKKQPCILAVVSSFQKVAISVVWKAKT